MKTKLHICYICVVDPCLAQAPSLVGGSVSGSPQISRRVDSWSSYRAPILLGYVSLHWFPLPAGWSLSIYP
uniref:Uncharacterized protein n=1 Tax=Trichinella nativa TaxID=6335 RepID=A0A0V1KIS2_9BILA